MAVALIFILSSSSTHTESSDKMSDVTSGESSSDSHFSDYVSLPDEESTEIDNDVPLSVYAKRWRVFSHFFGTFPVAGGGQHADEVWF